MTGKRFKVIWECLDDKTEFSDSKTETVFGVSEVEGILNELDDKNNKLIEWFNELGGVNTERNYGYFVSKIFGKQEWSIVEQDHDNVFYDGDLDAHYPEYYGFNDEEKAEKVCKLLNDYLNKVKELEKEKEQIMDAKWELNKKYLKIPRVIRGLFERLR